MALPVWVAPGILEMTWPVLCTTLATACAACVCLTAWTPFCTALATPLAALVSPVALDAVLTPFATLPARLVPPVGVSMPALTTVPSPCPMAAMARKSAAALCAYCGPRTLVTASMYSFSRSCMVEPVSILRPSALRFIVHAIRSSMRADSPNGEPSAKFQAALIALLAAPVSLAAEICDILETMSLAQALRSRYTGLMYWYSVPSSSFTRAGMWFAPMYSPGSCFV